MRASASSDGTSHWDDLLTATRFFTRFRLGTSSLAEPGALAHAAWAFPVVGVAVGIVCGVVYGVAGWAGLPPLAAALIAVGAGVLATGGLHEDGLADMADGFGGGADASETLAIMRDPRAGAFAVLALVFSVGLRAAAVAALAGWGMALAAFIAAHAVARAGLAVALHLMPPARSDGLGASAGEPSAHGTTWSLGIAIVIALLMLGFKAGIGALVFATIVMAAIGVLAKRRIGGHTGDVLGAIEQGGEVAVLLAAASWAW